MVKLTVNIADKSIYEYLEKLSRKTNVSVEDLVKEVIGAAAIMGDFVVDSLVLENPPRIKGKRKQLRFAFMYALDMGFRFYRWFVRPLLKHLQCLEHYRVEDIEVNYEDGYIYFYLGQLEASTLYVDNIYLWIYRVNGEAEIAAEAIIDQNVPDEILDKIRELCSVVFDEISWHEDFEDLEDIDLYVGGIPSIMFEAQAEDYKYLPPITKISKIMKRIMMESGYNKWKKSQSTKR